MQNFRNHQTGELFYEPINLEFIPLLLRIEAWSRIKIWGFCPKCNSDAPELYDCKVCKWDDSSPFGKEKRERYWNDWKLQDYLSTK